MTDDELLSAYLDGEASADERARVQTDPALLTEVERLRMVRSQLADLEPPSIATRESQLAAALAAWDRLPAAERLGTREDAEGADVATLAAASAMSTTPATRDPWFRSRWLLGAAAALVVVAAAGIVLQRIDPRDDDSTAEEAPAAAGTAVDEGASDDEATSEQLGESAPAEVLTGSDIEAEAEAIEELEAEGGDDAVTHSKAVPDQGPPSDADITEFPELQSAADLIAFAEPALVVVETTVPTEEFAAEADLAADEAADQPVAEAPASTLPDCAGLGYDVLVGPAVYQGTAVMVGVDYDGARILAYDPLDCGLVESLPAPD